MKKFLLSLTLFAVSTMYVVYQYAGGGSAVPEAQATGSASASAPIAQQSAPQATPKASAGSQSSPSTPSPTPATPTPTPAPAQKPKGQYADGTYTGNAADAYYGYVQVQAVIQGGRLAGVTFLQYPIDRRTSQYINGQAMPELRQEAIQAQSANVSGVSGASDTTAAFRESLSNALAQAKT